MANMTAVNKAIKAKYQTLDIEAVRGNGYVWFDGDDGADKIRSVYAHPPVTSTESMIRMVIEEIENSFKYNDE